MLSLTVEQKKNLASKEWRLSHFYKIKNKRGDLITFNCNRAQREFNENKHTRNIILKSRQLGYTTLEAIDTLDDVLFTRNFDSLFIAQDLDTAQDIFANKMELAWRNFQLVSLYKVDNSSARKLRFDFGDGSVSSILVDSSGRSGTYRRVHITEFAKVCKERPDKAKEIIEGTIPAVPLDGRVDIESTADGEDGLFADMFWEAWNRGEPTKLTEFKAHFFNWTYDEEEMALIQVDTNLPYEFQIYQKEHNLTDIQITYYHLKWLSLNKNWQSLKKEYPTTPEEAFSYSGHKLFDRNRLTQMRKDVCELVDWTDNQFDRNTLYTQKKGLRQGDWVYFEEARIGHNYGAGVDCAEGVGQDSSTIVIWDFTPIRPKVIARYRNNVIAPDLFAYEIKNGCEKYGMAIVAVERNNHGHAVISKLKEIYPENNIYKDDKDKFGWLTNLVSKPKMMFDFNTAINDDLVEIPSGEIISEMFAYDKEELSERGFDDEKTKHYDLLVATAIGFQMKNELNKVNQEEVGSYTPNLKEFRKPNSTIRNARYGL